MVDELLADIAYFERKAKEEKERMESFQEAAKPLIKWLNDNCHPHHTVIVTTTNAELNEGQLSFNTIEFLKD